MQGLAHHPGRHLPQWGTVRLRMTLWNVAVLALILGALGGVARYTAPAERLASRCGRPPASCSPSNVSPAECATMNHGGTPAASSAPIIEPALVPTMRSAVAGSHPVSVARACSPPVSHAPPITPPAPSTSPTLMRT